MTSDSEFAMRIAVARRVGEVLPTATILHEVAVANRRADMAAVTADRLYLFEIKSERDTLHRLSAQVAAFHPCCHGLIVVAHEKWCGAAADYPNCDARKVLAHHGAGTLWQYPVVVGQPWNMGNPTPPWPAKMLSILTASEIRTASSREGIATTARSLPADLISSMAATLTGTQIERAVCSALLSRASARLGVAA